ncbi:DUF5107 domain-containing protein [Streptomyces sp. AJS327]|uniref:DUF5107 domain-containing protein n=1 Tax=Streptomyces sp. AJS327 TaxID=2545265 RepID=UPI0015DED39A|nr:DUF5107 domain-containing protein [Streptomyces sp. AJS327]MBA0052191.1 DUF5107 domain-containing protein [Streptomyces sp. AJS327]
MATTVRRSTVTLPVAALGAENPLPPLLPLARTHTVDAGQRAQLPPDMARQTGYAPPPTVLPTRVLDGYGRHRVPTELDALVLESDRLRVTVLPGLGGRVWSLFHKPSERELLYSNPVVQPANFALNGAWFSGGIEWNIGTTGHSTLSCAPVHAGIVPAPDGGRMLRLWEWERLRNTPFQVDLWLPEGSDFLHVGVRVRNPHDRTVPVYWWSNTAVPETEDTRVLAPADETWHFGYDRTLRRMPLPEWEGVDRSYPSRGTFPADFFHELPVEERRWIAALDGAGRGLAQTSTDVLRGRKLFVWGSGPGGRRWQRWLTEPGTPGYAEIQAGLARTQLEHLPLAAGEELTWVEAYGPLAADPELVHGADWRAARAHAAERLEEALGRAELEAAYAAWRGVAEVDPEGPPLAVGSGWGALEVERGGYRLPGTPFRAETMGGEQEPWRRLLHTGVLPVPDRELPPGPTLVAPEWREVLEAADADAYARYVLDYHLGVAQWHAGDRSQAVRSWERSLGHTPNWPAQRCLAVAAAREGDAERAAERWLSAYRRLGEEWRAGERWTAALAALARETVEGLLAVGRAAEARAVLEGEDGLARLPREVAGRGRFRLLRARVLAALGEREAALEIFGEGFEVDDLREGEEALGETWAALSSEPLPERYDFRMRPA